MKKLKVALFLFYFTFMVNNTFSQVNNVITPKHSHPEYEKEIQEMKTMKDNADKTYQLAQDNYNAAKDYEKRMESNERLFLQILALIFSILGITGLVSYTYNNYLTRKARKEANKEMKEDILELKTKIIDKHAKEIRKITAENEKIIKEIITKKGKDSETRKDAKILVINHKETKVSFGFKKVLSLFDSFDLERDIINVDKLSDSLKKEIIDKLKKVDLIIVENQDQINRWNINGKEEPDSTSISEINENTPDELSDIKQNKSIMAKLANEICNKTSLVYYGPGLFPIENVEPNKQHLIAFANSPSTLYSNIMNMLKFQDVLKREE